MTLANHRAAARNGALVIALTLLGPAPTAFAGEPKLTLPLATVIALCDQDEGGATGEHVPRSRRPALFIGGPVSRGQLGFLPSDLHIPDAYALDDDRSIPRFAAPIDSDRMVSYDLVERPKRGWKAFVAYDSEDRGPFPGGGDVLSIIAEFRFH
jgi:hypothetical protein